MTDWLVIDTLDLEDATTAVRFGSPARLLANVNTPDDLDSLE